MLDASATPPSVVCTITVGTSTTSSPNNLAISPDGLKLYVENDAEASVTIVDLTTAATTTLSLPGVSAPITANLAVSQDNKLVYVVSLPTVLTSGAVPSLSILDLTATTPAFSNAQAVGSTATFNPGIGVSFVYNSVNDTVPSAFVTIDANTYIWSTTTNTITATAQTGGATPAPVTGGTVEVDPTGAFAVVVDAASNNQVANIPTATPTAASVLSPTPQCTLGHTVAITPTGSSAYYSCQTSNFVQVIATASNTVTATVNLPVSSSPHGLAITSDNSSAYVANGNGSLSTVAIPTTSSTTAVTTSLGSASLGGIRIMPVRLSISPATVSVPTGKTLQFTSSLRFPFGSKSVSWTVSCTAGGAACGSINSTGNYTAPNVIPNSTVTVTATYPDIPASTQKFFPVTAIVTVTPSQLAFTTQPANGTAGSPLANVAVSVEDANGNVVPGSTASVTISSTPGGVGGTTTVAAVNGVATFSNLVFTKAGSYTLTAASTGLTGATSNSLTIAAGAATMSAYTTPPANGTAASPLANVVVSVEDANGNVVPGSTASITITSTPAGVSGTTTVTAVNGVATFSNLVFTKAGSYTLTSAGTGLTSATSNSFTIAAGAATTLAFTVQPTNAIAGAAITPAVQVSIEDANGNVVTTATNAVTIAIGTNPGGGTLSGTATAAAVAGVATFSTLSIDKTGTGYTLAASSAGFTGATSTAFNVTPGTPAKLAFTVQPTNVVAGAAIAPAVQVSIEDAKGNVVTSDTSSVSITISAGGAFSGSSTTTVAASSGVATFSNLVPTKAGTFTLSAGDGSLTGATSNSFMVNPAAPSKLVFTTAAQTLTAGVCSAAITVQSQDQFGNPSNVTANTAVNLSSNSTGTAIFSTNNTCSPSTSSTTISTGQNSTSFFYSDTKAGAPTITASASAAGLTNPTQPETVNPAAAASLVFATQPAGALINVALTPAVVVNLLDKFDNLATSSPASVTVTSSSSSQGAGVVSGTTTVAASNGVATFTNLQFTIAGAYTLTAASGALTSATSSQFTITSNVTVSVSGPGSIPLPASANNPPTVAVGFSVCFVATINGDPNNLGVGSWKASPSVGTFSAGPSSCNGVTPAPNVFTITYTVPAGVPSPATVGVTASAMADPSKTSKPPNILQVVADQLVYDSAALSGQMIAVPSNVTSGTIVIDLQGPANTPASAFACTDLGKLNGKATCSFAVNQPPPASLACQSKCTSITLTLSVVRTSATLLDPVSRDPRGRLQRMAAFVLLLPVLVFGLVLFRRPAFCPQRFKHAFAFVFLLCLTLGWVSACNQFTTPATPPSPIPPAGAGTIGNLTVTATPGSSFGTVTISVPYLVQ